MKLMWKTIAGPVGGFFQCWWLAVARARDLDAENFLRLHGVEQPPVSEDSPHTDQV
jgi:hypothetical protein